MKRLALFLILIVLTGCTENEAASYTIKRIEGHKKEENSDFFTGAYIEFNENIMSTEDFEEKCGTHDVYAKEVFIDEPKEASDFILMCYAKEKTPYIIIRNREDFGELRFRQHADKMAAAIGKYQVEVMVEILENSYYYDENEYLAKTISEENNKAIKVWSVRYDDVILAEKNVPDYADMVCVNGYIKDENSIKRFFDLNDDIDKDIIIRFGAAVYSSEDCTYRTEEVFDTINYAYDRISDDKRYRGIIYMNKSEKLSKKVAYTDYSVISDKKLSEKYKELIENINKEADDIGK